MENPEVKATFSNHKDWVLTLCFSPDQTELCSGGYDKKVILTNLQNQTEKVFTGHRHCILGSDFSSNGNFLATGSTDRTIRIWNVSESVSGNSTILEGNSRGVNCVRYFRNDQNHVISGSDDLTIKIWNIERKRKIKTLRCEGNVFCVDILPDNQTIVSGDYKLMRIFDLRSGKCVKTLENNSYDHLDYSHKTTCSYYSVQFHPNSLSFASGSTETIKIFDFRTFQLLQDYKEHSFWVYSLCFHPSGKYLISGSRDTKIKVFDLLEKKVLFTLEDHSKSVRSVQFSPDGKFFASASHDENVLLWKVEFSLFSKIFH